MTEFCPETSVSREFLRELNRRAALGNIPVAGSLELTARCNFQCLHCYLDHSSADLPAGMIKSVLDQIADAGCLFLLLTGGEPLLRPDFPDIYEHAAKKGMLLTVFTNGSLISDAVISLFKNFPPQAVDITLYGASDATCRAVTGCDLSVNELLKGTNKLIAAGIRVKLKSVILRRNVHEIPAIEKNASSLGVPFRLDPLIFSRLNGDRAPVDFRVSPEQAVELEFSNPDRAADWRRHYERAKGIEPSGRLYSCGAGVTSFHINASGMLQPCIMTPHIQYDLKRGPFAGGWREISRAVGIGEAPENWRCAGCKHRPLCGICPGYAWFETGSESKPADYFCKIGEMRYKYLSEVADDANRQE